MLPFPGLLCFYISHERLMLNLLVEKLTLLE